MGINPRIFQFLEIFMKFTKLLLALFVFFVGFFGGCRTVYVPVEVVKEKDVTTYYLQREAVSLEFIDRNLSKINKVSFFLSSPVDINTDELHIVEEVNERGMVIRKYPSQQDDIKMNIDDVGIIIPPIINKEKSIDVFFEKKNVTLNFERKSNSLVNRYELDSVKIDRNYHKIYFTHDRPYLVFHSEDERASKSTRAHIITQGRPSENNSGNITSDQIYVLNSNSILKGSNLDIIVDYIRRENRNVPSYARSVINTYFYEAEREGVNPDLAIAQMLQHVNFFKNTARIKTNNYGALYKNSRTQYSFRDNDTGIRAHIQFLKYSADGVLKPPLELPPNVIKGLEKVKGKRQTLKDISPSYGGNNYARSVSEIYNELRNYVLKSQG